MSMENPVFMIDAHPEFQRDLNFERAAEEGYEGVLVKTSQGSKFVPDGFAPYFRRARDAMDFSGVYHFLGGTATGRAQADHFLSTIDNVVGLTARSSPWTSRTKPRPRRTASFTTSSRP